jgi:hypothetical protein
VTVRGLNVAHLVSSHLHHELVDALGGGRRQRRWTHEARNLVGTSIDFLPDVAAEPVRSARIDRPAFLACP